MLLRKSISIQRSIQKTAIIVDRGHTMMTEDLAIHVVIAETSMVQTQQLHYLIALRIIRNGAIIARIRSTVLRDVQN